MNQTQVKELLLEIREDVEEFSVIFSGKKSKKVDGLYKPESREIIIHNRNTEDENAIIYTAIHEFAHHVHITESPGPVPRRAHNSEYWSILHGFLARAEQLDIYTNKFKSVPEFRELTEELKDNYILKNGELMKNFGKLLIKAYELCLKYDMSFDDYADRELGLGRTAAKQLIRVYKEDINPSVGYDNMKTLARLKPGEGRDRAESAFLTGSSPDSVRTGIISSAGMNEDPVVKLEKERKRIERSIQNLNRRLAEIEKSLAGMSGD